MKTEVVFSMEGSPISVNLSADTFEKTEDRVVLHLSYWEVWELIRGLSDMKAEVKI